MLQNQGRQLLLHVEIPAVAGHRPVAALPGDEVEVRKTGLLLCLGGKGIDLTVTDRALQVGGPHVHGAPVPADQRIHGLVRLMVNLPQMLCTLRVDRHEPIIPDTHRAQSNTQGNGSKHCCQAFAHEIPSIPVDFHYLLRIVT